MLNVDYDTFALGDERPIWEAWSLDGDGAQFWLRAESCQNFGKNGRDASMCRGEKKIRFWPVLLFYLLGNLKPVSCGQKRATN